MNCREFEQRLNDILDGRGDPAAEPRLAAHARACEGCRQLLAGQRALFAGLAQLVVPTPANGFSRLVVAEAAGGIGAAASRPPRKIWLAVGALLASAAAALLAVSLVWYARRGELAVVERSIQPAPAVAHGAESRPSRFAITQRGPSSRRGPSSGGPAMTQPSLLIEVTRLPGHVRFSIDSLPATLPDTVERLNEVEHLAPGIRPIRLSLTVLWDALCRALPGAHSDEQPPPRGRTSFIPFDLLSLA